MSLWYNRRVRRHPIAACLVPLALAASPGAERAREPPVEQVLASLDRYFETYRLALGGWDGSH